MSKKATEKHSRLWGLPVRRESPKKKKKNRPPCCLYVTNKHMNLNVSWKKSAACLFFFGEAIRPSDLDSRPKNVQTIKNSILCIEDVRRDCGAVAEANQMIEPKQQQQQKKKLWNICLFFFLKKACHESTVHKNG